VTARLRSDSGSATILVTTIGALALIIGFRQFDAIVVEHQGIDDSLLEVRAYWAAKGHLNYALSRTMFAGGCVGAGPCGENPDVVSLPTAYLQDIACYRAWSYPELANYQFVLMPTVANDPNAPAKQVGEILIRVTFAQSGIAPAGCSWGSSTPTQALSALTHVRPVEFRYCLTNDAGNKCDKNPGANIPGFQAITSTLRPSS